LKRLAAPPTRWLGPKKPEKAIQDEKICFCIPRNLSRGIRPEEGEIT